MTRDNLTFSVIRRTVSIAGRVTDALSGRPLARALVAVSAGPPEFQIMRAALTADPLWERQTERLDRRLTRPDGWYAFSALPVGSYSLEVSVPQLGTRYRLTTPVSNVTVAPPPAPDQRLNLTMTHVVLQPTRIRGRVTRNGGQPVAGVKVRLRGDTDSVLTDDDGRYVLAMIVAGKPTIEVTAKTFRPFSQALSLDAGQERIVDVVLSPV